MNFKRLLKPILVILAILILTLSVSAGDLFGTYDKRIKLTVDHTKIDADLSWFPVTVFLGNYREIDVGVEAIDRDYTITSDRTVINKTNPANASGKITSVEIYASSNMTGAIVVTFYRPDPTGQPDYLVARDSYEIGSVTAGSKQTFEVDLDVEAGDYLGVYFSAGWIERDNSGGDGIWYKVGNYTQTTGDNFDPIGNWVLSLYATGFTINGEEVFTEFDADADFDRIAFTTSDGVTQLYADCELFDVSEQKAIYHVSKTGWTVSSSTDTDIYLYYDNTADHNTTYISKSGGTAAQSVWDSDFKAVYHMNDPDPTGTDELDDDFEDNNLTEYIAGSHWATASDQKYAGTYSAKASGGEDSWSDRQLQFTLSEPAKYIKYDFYWRCNDATGGKYYRIITNPLHLLEGGNSANTNFSYFTSGGSQRNLPTNTSFVADTWYHIEVYHDTVNDFAMYWIDGNYKGKATDIETSDAITTVKFGNEDTSGDDSWFDDITVTVYDTPLYRILDSTSNGNHGYKNGPIEATGKVGQGQDFDGTDDYILTGSDLGITGYPFTFEAIAKWSTGGALITLLDKSESNVYWQHAIRSHYPSVIARNTVFYEANTSSNYTDSAWHYSAAVYTDATTRNIYADDGSNTGSDSDNVSFTTNTDQVSIGNLARPSPADFFNGIIDEVRISSTNRSAAWIGATYDSLWDTLLTYGSEETAPTGEVTNVLFIFSNF